MTYLFLCFPTFLKTAIVFSFLVEQKSDPFEVASFDVVDFTFDHHERIGQLLVFQALEESLVLVSWHLELLSQDSDIRRCLVLDLRGRELEEHDEEMATGEA